MRNFARIVLCSAVLALVPTIAAAEPFRVDFFLFTLQRWDYRAQTFEPFFRGFELTMTFSGESRIRRTATGVIREYEPPTFTAVPDDLVVASRPPGINVIDRRRMTDQWQRVPEGYRRFTTASIATLDEATDGNRFFRGLALTRGSTEILSSPPELTMQSLATQLGQGGFNQAFLYTGIATDEQGRYLPNSFQYQGTAQLIGHNIPPERDPVIPEPGTLVLIGGSLAYLGVRFRKQR